MEQNQSRAERAPSRRTAAVRPIARGVLRLFRLPFDLLFLTWDYLRFTLWAVLQPWTPLLASRLTRFGPHAASDIIEVSGRRVRRCALARKYGSPALLRLLVPGIFPVRARHGKTVWAWEQGSIQRPSTATRYITLGLGLLLAWGGAALLAAAPASRHAIRRQLARLHHASPRAVTEPDRDPGLVQRLCAEGDRLLAAASYREACARYREVLAADPGNAAALLGDGLAALELGLNDEAQANLAAVRRDAPGNSQAAWGLAQLAYRTGTYSTAVDLLRPLSASQPGDVRVQAMLADSLRRLGELDQALAVALAGLQQNPADGKLILTAAAIHVDREDLDEAEKLFRRALEAGETAADGRVGLARLLRIRGRTAECEAALKSVLEDFPDHPEAVLMLVDLWAAQGETTRAADLCAEVTQRHPANYGLRERLGALLLARGDYDGAYVSASTLLREQPGNLVAHLQLATIFVQKGLPSLAIEHCRIVLLQDRGMGETHRILAAAYMMKGDPAQALPPLETILRDFPNDLESLVRLAECQARSGDPMKALDTLAAAAQRHPRSPIPFTELGRRRYALGQPEETLAAFRKAYELAPNEWTTQNNLALTLACQGKDLEQALDLATKAFAQAPTNPNVADTLGWIHVLRGDCREAAPLLTFALVASGNSAQVLYHCAELKARTGDPESAIRLARRAIELGPDYPDVGRARQLVEKLMPGEKH